MAKRRPSGDGMVRKRDDGRWEGRIVVGHKENGDSIFRYVSAKTQKTLMEKLHRCIVEYDGAELTEDCRMTLPKKVTAAKTILNDKQLERFMEAIKTDEHWHDFFYLEITTGLRRGEICGLMWTDFDVEKGTLTVRRTLHNKEGGGYYVGETKTGAGCRIIKLPPSTVHLLSERKRASISQWIFPNPIHPEDPIMPNSGYTRMKKLLAEAGLPDMRFHDLRHTFATHALTSGVDAKTLSGILGHTKTSFTLDTYTHVTGDMHRKASGIVSEFMNDFVVKG